MVVVGMVQEFGIFYLGVIGGGVWKIIDYGMCWINVLDGFFFMFLIGVMSVVLIDFNIVYVGIGFDGLWSNVIFGKGMYKFIDVGIFWMYIGLD